MTTKRMYGVTHSLKGEPIVRESRAIKIGIGLPKGKALHVWIDANEKWCVQVGKETTRMTKMEEARKFFLAAKANAPDRKYPERLSYFTFTKVTSQGVFEPDFEIIAQHGSIPTEIDIVFLRDDPFDCSYQWWTAAEKKCEGDGKNAERILALANGFAEGVLVTEAKKKGSKTFPIIDGCWMYGCPYAKPDENKKPRCKPHGRLLFQLAANVRLGGTAYFDTTGFRSINQIFSSLEIFRYMTGRGDPEQGHVAGIPFTMVLRPYKVSHDGIASTQYAASLEYRAEDALSLKQNLIDQGAAYQMAGRLLHAAPADISELLEVGGEEETQLPPPINAAAITSEFYSESDPEEFASLEETTLVECINEEQRRAIIKLAEECGCPGDTLSAIVASEGVQVLAEITLDHYEQVLIAVQNWNTSAAEVIEPPPVEAENDEQAIDYITHLLALTPTESVPAAPANGEWKCAKTKRTVIEKTRRMLMEMKTSRMTEPELQADLVGFFTEPDVKLELLNNKRADAYIAHLSTVLNNRASKQ